MTSASSIKGWMAAVMNWIPFEHVIGVINVSIRLCELLGIPCSVLPLIRSALPFKQV
jgi:hypothetical protein